jgi:hypothetical protein
MNIRLSVTDRRRLALALKEDIEQASKRLLEEGPRNHLGASEIGEPCARRLVYSFRWMWREQFDGRMLRLFNRGHLEEARIIKWLEAIGCEAKSHDANGNQFRIGVGHFGGSLDGLVRLPEKYQLVNQFLLEMKTHGAKSFKKLIELGMKQSKPEHYKQMCCYGAAYKLDYGIYFAVCKDTDEIEIEIVEIDPVVAEQMEHKAAGIVSAERLPFKIAASSAFIDCKFCPMVPICHERAPPAINCRSCAMSRPAPDKQWFCSYWQANIPQEAIPAACPHWKAFS